MTGRTPEDVARGVLRVHLGGTERELPTLKIKASDAWVNVATERLGFGVLHLADDQSAETVTAFAALATETMLDLVLAYDQSGALGGREWLEEHADPAEMYTALRQMGQVALPFVSDLSTLLAVASVRVPQLVSAVAGWSSPNSTNGRSRPGASTARRSKAASTMSS